MAVANVTNSEANRTELYEYSERKALEVVHAQIISMRSKTCVVTQAVKKREREVLDHTDDVDDQKSSRYTACFLWWGRHPAAEGPVLFLCHLPVGKSCSGELPYNYHQSLGGLC